MRALREKLSYANVMATIAVFIALGGGAYALTLGKNDVRSRHIAPNAAKGRDIAERTLKAVPNARALGGVAAGGYARSGSVSGVMVTGNTTSRTLTVPGAGEASIVGCNELGDAAGNPEPLFRYRNTTGATQGMWFLIHVSLFEQLTGHTYRAAGPFDTDSLDGDQVGGIATSAVNTYRLFAPGNPTLEVSFLYEEGVELNPGDDHCRYVLTYFTR